MSQDRVRRGFHRLGLVGAVPAAGIALFLGIVALTWWAEPEKPVYRLPTKAGSTIPLIEPAQLELANKIAAWDDQAVGAYYEAMRRGRGGMDKTTPDLEALFAGNEAYDANIRRSVGMNSSAGNAVLFALGALAWYLSCWTVGWLIRGFMRDA